MSIIDGVSYSWEGNGQNEDPNPSNYTDQRRTTSGGTGYILDFGSPQLNQKFKDSLKSAYEGTGDYKLTKNNCGDAFNNTFAKFEEG